MKVSPVISRPLMSSCVILLDFACLLKKCQRTSIRSSGRLSLVLYAALPSSKDAYFYTHWRWLNLSLQNIAEWSVDITALSLMENIQHVSLSQVSKVQRISKVSRGKMFQSKCMDDGAEVGTLCADNYDPTFATVVLCNTEMQAQMGNNLLSSQHLIARTRLPQIIRPLVKKTF